MTGNTSQLLPDQFSELNQYIDRWDNRGMADQYAARVNSTMEEMQGFYDAVKARIPEIREYLDSKEFSEYSEGDRILGNMVIAWVPVAESVEVFKQPTVPDSKSWWKVVEEPGNF